MKLSDLKEQARGGIDPEDLGQCEFDECPQEAVERDADGAWCWAHRQKMIRETLLKPKPSAIGPVSAAGFTGAPSTVAFMAGTGMTGGGPVGLPVAGPVGKPVISPATARSFAGAGMTAKEVTEAVSVLAKGGIATLPRGAMIVVDDLIDDKPMTPVRKRKLLEWWEKTKLSRRIKPHDPTAK